MDTFNVHGYRLGYLGDQTFYTILNHLHPSLVYTIKRFSRCDSGCSLLHANQGPVKCIVRHLQETGNISCPVWQSFVDGGPNCLRIGTDTQTCFQGALRRFYHSCCR